MVSVEGQTGGPDDESTRRKGSSNASGSASARNISAWPPAQDRPGELEDRASSLVTISAQGSETVEPRSPAPTPTVEQRSRSPRVSIVIPTLNENGNVSKLVMKIENLFSVEPEVIIVDDNSSDGTVESVLSLRQRFERIHVIQREIRGGIGSAVREGIRFALDHTESDYVVTMDADWSHDPDQLPELLRAGRDADFVQGSRYAEGGRIVGWPPMRRLASIIGNNTCRILFNTGLHEHTTFYRVFNRECAQLIVANVLDDGYAWGVRSLLEAMDAGFKAVEVPITFVERTNGESKLGVREMAGWLSSVVRLFVQRRRES